MPTPDSTLGPCDLTLTTSPPGEAAAAFCQHFSDHMGTGTATPLLPPPHGAQAPPHPPPGPAMQGESRGAGMAQGAHPPSLLPGSRLGEGGREGTGRGGSSGRRKSGLEESWGLCREGGAGPGRRAGRGGFPEPSRCGAWGPDVQRGGEGWWRRLGRDAAAAPAPSPASQVGGGSRPGQGSRWGPTPRVTGAARVPAELRAE